MVENLKCDECGSENVIIQGGNCPTCIDCGYSACPVA